MITRIKLQNFKAHANIELKDLPLITVLVGRNNTGKSSVLHAAVLPKYHPQLGPTVPIGNSEQVLREGADTGRVEITTRTPPTTWAGIFNRGQGYSNGWVGTAGDYQKLVNSLFYLSAIRQPTVGFNYQPFAKDVGPQGERTWNNLHQMKAVDDPRFPTILDWAKRLGMGITSLGIPTTSPGVGEVAPMSYGHRANLVLHGSGTWSVLPILTQGILCENDDTLLIEEPEIHLHRESIDSLWDFFGDCAKRGVQIMCATHSLDLLASMHSRIEAGIVPKDSVIYHLRRDDDGATVAEKRDVSVFRNIRTVIKKELAGEGI